MLSTLFDPPYHWSRSSINMASPASSQNDATYENSIAHQSNGRSDTNMGNEEMTPELFVDLMHQFYQLGWMHGSGGGMACCVGESIVYYSPSSVQKERLKE